MLRTAFAIVALSCVLAAPANAQSGPVVAVPGRPGVPVMINGYDAAYAIVEGDWGLYRPGAVPVTVIYGPTVIPGPPGAGYFPRTGRRPQSGRHEVWPPADRKLPPPAPSFHRSWSTSSDMAAPVTEYPPYDPPPVILAPEIDAEKTSKRPRFRFKSKHKK
jgi:hypothetical protein